MASYHDPPDLPPAQNWILWAAPPPTWTDWWGSSSPRLTDSLCGWSRDRFHSPGCWSSPGKPIQVHSFVTCIQIYRSCMFQLQWHIELNVCLMDIHVRSAFMWNTEEKVIKPWCICLMWNYSACSAAPWTWSTGSYFYLHVRRCYFCGCWRRSPEALV